MPQFYANFQPLITVFGPPLMAAFLAWLTVWVKGAFEKLPTAQRNNLTSFVSTAVNAVEQSEPNMPNTVKKAKALEAIEAQLNHFGLKVPAAVIDANLEEAVLLLNIAQGKANKAPVAAAKGQIIPSNLTGVRSGSAQGSKG